MPASRPLGPDPNIPSPYDNEKPRIKRSFVQIHKRCGQWPWEFLGDHTPASWSQSLLEQLAKAVGLAVDASVSLPHLVNHLLGTSDPSNSDPITWKGCEKAVKELSNLNGGNAAKTASSARSKRTRPNDVQTDSSKRLDQTSSTSPASASTSIHKRATNPTDSTDQPSSKRQRHDEGDDDAEVQHPDNDDGDNRTYDGIAQEDKDLSASEERLASARERLKRYEYQISKETATIAALDNNTISATLGDSRAKRDKAIEELKKCDETLTSLLQIVDSQGSCLPPELNMVVEKARTNREDAAKVKEKSEVTMKEVQAQFNKEEAIRKKAQEVIDFFCPLAKDCKNDIDEEERHQKAILLRRKLDKLSSNLLKRMSAEQLSDWHERVEEVLALGDGGEEDPRD